MSAAILSMLPKRKGRQGPEDGRSVLRLFPIGRGGRTFVYAIAFDGGVVKIGQTGAPRKRLLDHWKTGNGEVKWIHLFESMHRDTARRVEMSLPAAISAHARQINGSEWFFATDRAEVIRVVRETILREKASVRAHWSERDAERDAVRAVSDFMRANGLLKTERRP